MSGDKPVPENLCCLLPVLLLVTGVKKPPLPSVLQVLYTVLQLLLTVLNSSR